MASSELVLFEIKRGHCQGRKTLTDCSRRFYHKNGFGSRFGVDHDPENNKRPLGYYIG